MAWAKYTNKSSVIKALAVKLLVIYAVNLN